MTDKKRDRLFLIAVFIMGMLMGALEDLWGQRPTQEDSARARAIVQRHVEAVGGEAALSAAQPTHMVMTMSMGSPDVVTRMETWKSGRLFYNRMEAPGMGTTEMGFDGKTAWMLSSQIGAMILDSLPSGSTGPKDYAEELKRLPVCYLGVREFAGRKYEAVRIQGPDGTSGTMYFNPSTGVMAGMTPDNTPGPPGQMTMSFEDWKRFGSQWYATRMTTRTADGKELVTRVESVSNEPIDAARFELPAKVRELQTKRP